MFRSPEYVEIDALIQRMGRVREGMLDREVHLRRDGQAVALLASATALRGPDGGYVGMVLAFDDLTELLKAQRLAAWREVAQRIAHEIKNPLTPIQLSAQRLRRRLASDRSPDEKRLLEEATGTIIQEVDGLRQLVDEFSRFARMPALDAQADRSGAGSSKAWWCSTASRTRASRSVRVFSPDLPPVEVDPDQIKRAVLNLVDNAVEAVGGTGEVVVQTVWLPEAHRARIVVADDGPGIAARRPGPALRALLLHQGDRHGPRPAHRPPDRRPTTAARSGSRTTRRTAAASSSSCPPGARWPRRCRPEVEEADARRAHPDRGRRAGDPHDFEGRS